MTAEECTKVWAGGRCEAKMFHGQEMTFGYISMTELTLRAIHVLVGRKNYPTGRISECHKLSYIVFIIGLISTTLSSPSYKKPPQEKLRLFSWKRLVIEGMFISEYKTDHRKLPSQGTFCLSLFGVGWREGWGEWLWRYCKQYNKKVSVLFKYLFSHHFC